jgi:hypothetical protein
LFSFLFSFSFYADAGNAHRAKPACDNSRHAVVAMPIPRGPLR